MAVIALGSCWIGDSPAGCSAIVARQLYLISQLPFHIVGSFAFFLPSDVLSLLARAKEMNGTFLWEISCEIPGAWDALASPQRAGFQIKVRYTNSSELMCAKSQCRESGLWR